VRGLRAGDRRERAGEIDAEHAEAPFASGFAIEPVASQLFVARRLRSGVDVARVRLDALGDGEGPDWPRPERSPLLRLGAPRIRRLPRRRERRRARPRRGLERERHAHDPPHAARDPSRDTRLFTMSSSRLRVLERVRERAGQQRSARWRVKRQQLLTPSRHQS
jgi:hypothetical protein